MIHLSFSVNAVTTVEGEVIHFPIPTSERVLSPSEVSDEERTVHPEFFENRSSKTPERYLRIRNYITESWYEKCHWSVTYLLLVYSA